MNRRRMREVRRLEKDVRSNDPGRLHLVVARLTEREAQDHDLLPAERRLLAEAHRRLGQA